MPLLAIGEGNNELQRIIIARQLAKLFATEAAVENSMEAMRIHGAYGYSKEFIIARQLVERNPV